MKPTGIIEQMHYTQGAADFLDFALPRLTLEAHQELTAAYFAWNRRPGGELEDKPLPGGMVLENEAAA